MPDLSGHCILAKNDSVVFANSFYVTGINDTGNQQWFQAISISIYQTVELFTRDLLPDQQQMPISNNPSVPLPRLAQDGQLYVPISGLSGAHAIAAGRFTGRYCGTTPSP